MFVEFRELEKSSNKPDEFMDLFEEKIANLNYVDAVKVLRLSGITVDIYQTGKHRNLFKNCIDVIEKKYGCEASIEILKLVKESLCFNDLFKYFEKKRTEAGLTAIPKGEKIFPLILASEYYLLKLIFRDDADSIESCGPDNLGTIYDYLIKNLHKGNIDKATYIYELLVSNLGITLKYIHHQFNETINISTNRQLIETSAKHFPLAQSYKTVYELYERWRFFGLSIDNDRKANSICFEGNTPIIIDFAVNSSRYVNQIKGDQFFALKASRDMNFNLKTNKLPPEGYMCLEEFVTANAFQNRMHDTNIFQKSFFDIPVAEWIRAFSVIINLAKKIKAKTYLQSYCRIKKTKLINYFFSSGISARNANKIISYLIFKPNIHTDIFDAPLFELGKSDILIFKGLCYSLNFSEGFFSNLQSLHVDLSGRGYEFERTLQTDFNDAGLFAKPLYYKLENEEYQCDLAVVCEDLLMFIEAKVFFEPRNVRRYYEHIGKIENAVKQLTRIADFYSQNPNITEKLLDNKIDIKSAKIIKVLVTSTMYSGYFVINDTYIIDYSSLNRFLHRDPPSQIIIGKGNNGKIAETRIDITEYVKLYSDIISKKKMLKFLESQPAATLIKENLVWNDVTLYVDGKSLKYKIPIQGIPTVFGLVE